MTIPPATLRRALLGAAALAAAAAIWLDTWPRGTDGLTRGQRRYHARHWAHGAGRPPTRDELATFTERPRRPV
jgi:hypothetical protein